LTLSYFFEHFLLLSKTFLLAASCERLKCSEINVTALRASSCVILSSSIYKAYVLSRRLEEGDKEVTITSVRDSGYGNKLR